MDVADEQYAADKDESMTLTEPGIVTDLDERTYHADRAACPMDPRTCTTPARFSLAPETTASKRTRSTSAPRPQTHP